MKEQILEQLTAIRLELDEIYQTLRVHPLSRGTAHLGEHFTQNAFMWAGRCKGILGASNPYPKSSDPSSPVIEVAVDTFKGEIVIDQAETETAFVKRMRHRISECERTVQHGLMAMIPDHKLYHLAAEQIYVAVVNAKLYLGLRLGEIRDEQGPPVIATPADSGQLPEGDKLPPATDDSAGHNVPEMTASQGGTPETPAPQPQSEVPGPQPEPTPPAAAPEQTPSQTSSQVDEVLPPSPPSDQGQGSDESVDMSTKDQQPEPEAKAKNKRK